MDRSVSRQLDSCCGHHLWRTLKRLRAVFQRRRTTKYVGWPRHQSIEGTRVFLAFSEAEWSRWPAGPSLIECRGDRKLFGSTGFTFESPTVAATGYILARDA